jgi:indole-3-glycerol phosphate synthase
MIDSYQIYEAKAWGADVILLIAACLTQAELQSFTAEAHTLGMEVLGEAHSNDEVKALIAAGVDCIGINNRDLRSFKVSVQHSIDLRSEIPESIPAVSESGIDSAETVKQLRDFAFLGFLIGECFMRTEDPGDACRRFIEEVRCFG